MQEDYELIRRSELATTGANVHDMNMLRNGYRNALYQCNHCYGSEKSVLNWMRRLDRFITSGKSHEFDD